ncbi:asparaginase [Actinoplanes sp. HUAS TT8]|uniref:asparaginase n=1 Tax=Actinoplanes sp. HUAS TT8 TaxID=3447453 RepID=UPI003F51C1A2
MAAEPGGSRVLVVGLGGTIAMTSSGDGGVAPTLSARQLLDAVPGLDRAGVEVEALTFRTRPGGSLTIDDLVELVGVIGERLATGVAGVVVTQGTDTIEETAYVLDLLHARPEPVVITGAMRNPMMAGADGPANLLAAILVAADPAARGHGCLVVLADEIHAARRVRKLHSTSVAAFGSPDGGAVGYVIEGRPHLINRPAGRHVLPVMAAATPVVALYTATLGDDDRVLRAVATGVDGLVVAGFGVGHVSERWVPALAEAAARIPVVLASRTGAGAVLSDTYGFSGSERDLLDRGLVGAGLLHPYKARILLHLAMATGADRRQIRDAFAAAGGMAAADSWPWPGHRAG